MASSKAFILVLVLVLYGSFSHSTLAARMLFEPHLTEVQMAVVSNPALDPNHPVFKTPRGKAYNPGCGPYLCKSPPHHV